MGREKRKRASSEGPGTEVSICSHAQLDAFRKLNEMRKQGVLVDVRFRVRNSNTTPNTTTLDNTTTSTTSSLSTNNTDWVLFGAHRCVVSAMSEPMCAMLSNGMRESQQMEITLDDTDVNAFSLLLDFLYGERVAVRQSNVVCLLAISAKWGVTSLRDECASFLFSCLTAANCCDILCMADTFGCDQLHERALSFVYCHFEQVSTTPRFVDLPLDTVKEILGSDRLWRYNEMTIFTAAVTWLQAREDRVASRGEVMELIRLALINPVQLVQQVKPHPVMQSPHTIQLYNHATEYLTLVLGKQQTLDSLNRRCSGARMLSNVNRLRDESGNSDGVVYSLASLPQASVVVAGFESGTIRVWDAESWECVGSCTGHSKAVGALVRVGDKLVSGSHDCTLRVWDTETWQCDHVISGQHTQGVWTLAVASDSETLISGSYDTTIKVWDTTTWECERTIDAHEDEIEMIKVCGNLLVSAADDRTIKVWNMSSWECEQTLLGHTDAVMALAVVDKRLVSSAQDGSIRVWNTETWACEIVVQPQTIVRTLAVINRKLISGGGDGSIAMWSVDTWQRERSISQCQDEVEVLLVVDGYLVSGSGGGSVMRWELL